MQCLINRKKLVCQMVHYLLLYTKYNSARQSTRVWQAFAWTKWPSTSANATQSIKLRRLILPLVLVCAFRMPSILFLAYTLTLATHQLLEFINTLSKCSFLFINWLPHPYSSQANTGNHSPLASTGKYVVQSDDSNSNTILTIVAHSIQ